MPFNIKVLVLCTLTFFSASSLAAKVPSMPEVLAAAGPADWRPLDPDNRHPIPAGIGKVARSPSLHRTWLAHCYGMVGVGNVPIAVREQRPAAAHSS